MAGGVVRLNEDGTRDETFKPVNVPGVSAGFHSDALPAIAVQADGRILISSDPSYVGGALLLRLNSDGSRDSTFELEMNSLLGGSVSGITLQADGRIVFYSGGLNRVLCDGTLDMEFARQFLYTPPAPGPFALDAQNGVILGGRFNQVGPTPRQNLARLFLSEDSLIPPLITVQPADQSGRSGQTLTVPVAIASSGCVRYQWFFNGAEIPGKTNRALSLVDVRPSHTGDYGVVIANDWGSTTSRLARVEVEAAGTTPGETDVDFNPMTGFGDGAFALARSGSDGSIIAIGNRHGAEGSQPHWARIRSDGLLDASFTHPLRFKAFGTSPVVWTVAEQADGKLVLGGIFTSVKEQKQGGILRLNPDGSFDPSFNPGVGPEIGTSCCAYILAILPLADGKILVGGIFALVRLLPDGRIDDTFKVEFTPSGDPRAALVDPNDDLIVGGLITNVEGIPRQGVVRIHADSPGLRHLFSAGFDEGHATFYAQPEIGDRYVLEAKPAVTDLLWSPLTNRIGNGSLHVLTDPGPVGPERYYRLRFE